ncbi:ribosomal protein S5 domain 2-type protein [Podospora australis]|uniref:Ribosomal protein S5 domain 2-type protein n=1 Tax=Podospora australis TaxID=1536484 RepID=A0AAN7ANX1_9PEZI|nr:ribosomal protein S5 domain 2-type protein [Podospora australis]
MSEALLDEIEAINSIYGDTTLVRSPQDSDATIYILTLPASQNETPSLRIQFPPEYPDVPPSILGTHSTAGSKRGTAQRDLILFRDAVSEVYEPGQVCLFDAIEKVQELLSLSDDHPEEPEDSSSPNQPLDHHHQQAEVPEEEPPWTTSDPVIELKSIFLARTAPVSSPAQAHSYVQHLLSTDKRVRSATHNITAWRIRGPNGTSFQDCDDDGETAAGGRLLHLMQLMDLWDVMVIVTRWYGGQKLGPRRFALINQAARDAFVKAGLVAAADPEAAKGKKARDKHKS